MKLLANENCPRLIVDALTAAGHDVLWVRTAARGLVTFDKDFGELAFRAGLPATCGVILLRISLADPAAAAALVVATLASRTDWPGHFSVVSDRRIRMRLLPG